MDTLEQTIRKNAIKSGLIFGAISTTLGIFSYYLITGISKSPVWFVAGPLLLSIVFPIVIVILFCFDLRKKVGGYWTLRQAVTGIFIMFMVAYLFQTIAKDYIFSKLIVPDMADKTAVAAVNATTYMLGQAHATQAQIAQKVAEIKKGFEDQKKITPGQVIMNFAYSIIFIFVLAVIFGALFKKETPFYTIPVDEGPEV